MNATTTLYMSERGQIACKAHRPHPGSDSDYFDRWGPMPEAERLDFVRHLRREPECETCRAMRRNGATR